MPSPRQPSQQTEPHAASRIGTETAYWDGYLGGDGVSLTHQVAWLRFSRRLYSTWIERHLTHRGPASAVLKTDCFEEIRGGEVARELRKLFGSIVVIDISMSALLRAKRNLPDKGSLIVSAAQSLPFRNHSFDAVISLSTLDHLSSVGEIHTAMRQLFDLTKPGGELLLTLDNEANPVVRLRNGLPFALLHRLGIAPYRYGQTLTPDRLAEALTRAGWRIKTLTTVVHAPRVIAVALSRFVSEKGPLTPTRYERCLRAFERAAHWPTHWRTGHFILAVCTRDA